MAVSKIFRVGVCFSTKNFSVRSILRRIAQQKAFGCARYDRCMRGKWLLAAGSVILVALAAGLTRLRREESAKAPEVRNSTAADPSRELSLPGKIQAQHVIPVGAPVTGTIDSFLVDVGQDVYEGQLLAHIA